MILANAALGSEVWQLKKNKKPCKPDARVESKALASAMSDGIISTLVRKPMLPIVLQNLLSTANVLMLTHLSQTALSASSWAGQVTFVPTLFPCSG